MRSKQAGQSPCLSVRVKIKIRVRAGVRVRVRVCRLPRLKIRVRVRVRVRVTTQDQGYDSTRLRQAFQPGARGPRPFLDLIGASIRASIKS